MDNILFSIIFRLVFFKGYTLSHNEVVSVTDAQYLALSNMHNGIKPYDKTIIEYQADVYGQTTPTGIKLGDYADPGKNNGHHRWEVMGHKQGHNFFGSASYFYADMTIPGSFLQESLAVLSAFYTYHYIIDNQNLINYNKEILDSLTYDFTNGLNYQKSRYDYYIEQGMAFDISDVLVSQVLDYKMIEYAKIYGWDKCNKIARTFEDGISSKFSFHHDGVSPIEQSTYIVASLSFAFDNDFRSEFKDLNFPIDDNLFLEILPLMSEYHLEVSN